MAYQPKSYRKFIAGAAAAAVIAPAVAPVGVFAADVELTDIDGHRHEEAIRALVAEGIINGFPDGEFKPDVEIKRGDAAVMIARALDLLDGKNIPETNLTDLGEVNKVTQEAIAKLVDAGIVSGFKDGSFKPNNHITRGEMAKMIAEAYDLPLGDGETDFSDVSATQTLAKYVDAIAEVGITQGYEDGSFGYADNIKRGDFAKFVYNAENLEIAVQSVSVINEKTLELTGTGLKALKAEDVTLAGNVVASVTTTGSKATVTFQNGFPLDTEQTVKVGDKEFKFTYSIEEIKSVTLDAKTFDDDTEGQILTFKINGAIADTEWLRQAGYTVNYVAANENNAAANIFEGASSTSSTGLLDDEITVGDYSVEIQVSKDGKVVVSDKETITIADLESTTTAIDSVELTTDPAGVVLNSTTLVTGEVANITEITGDAAGKKDVELPVGAAEVTSSNPAVISVNGQQLTANVAGTATITIKIGETTKTINLTVESAAREVAKVTPSESTVKVVEGKTRTIEVTALDQYGDPIAVAGGDITEDIPENASSVDLVTADDLVTLADGETAAGYLIQGDEKGNGTIIFKDADNKVVGQIAVQVTDVDNEGSTKVEHQIATTPVDYTFDVGASEDYQVSIFNTNGFYNGAKTLNVIEPAAGELFVESADEDVATVTLEGTGVRVTGESEGKTDITFKNEAGQVVHKITVTIEEEDVTITKVNFKAAATVDYAGKTVSVEDVLDVRVDGDSDPIVYGVEHNANTIAKVRLDETTVDELVLYIDDNGDGELDATPGDDTILGAVTAEVLSGSETATPATPIAAITDITFGGGSYTTASGDKGTILFRVLVDGDDANTTYEVSEAVATTTLNINVK